MNKIDNPPSLHQTKHSLNIYFLCKSVHFFSCETFLKKKLAYKSGNVAVNLCVHEFDIKGSKYLLLA